MINEWGNKEISIDDIMGPKVSGARVEAVGWLGRPAVRGWGSLQLRLGSIRLGVFARRVRVGARLRSAAIPVTVIMLQLGTSAEPGGQRGPKA